MSSTKPLFYNRIAAISRERHSACGFNDDADYRFASTTNSVPLGVSEFAMAARCYPIVFLAQNDEVAPVAVLGTETDQNAWVDGEGHWLGDYIPAYVRRYPFIAVRTSEENMTLCIDETSVKLKPHGEGVPFFDKQGKQSEFLQAQIKLAEAYELELKRNQRLSSLLQAHDLLELAQLNKSSNGIEPVLSGFMVVSREKLQALESDALQQLNEQGALELIYQHLFSLECFHTLSAKSDGSGEVIAEGAA